MVENKERRNFNKACKRRLARSLKKKEMGLSGKDSGTFISVKDYIDSKRKQQLQLTSDWTAKELREFASTLGFGYVGCFIHSDGVEQASFQCEPSMVPFFPSDVPVALRTTYWRFRKR